MRECDAPAMLCCGRLNIDIARHMGRSPRPSLTVRTFDSPRSWAPRTVRSPGTPDKCWRLHLAPKDRQQHVSCFDPETFSACRSNVHFRRSAASSFVTEPKPLSRGVQEYTPRVRISCFSLQMLGCHRYYISVANVALYRRRSRHLRFPRWHT